MSLTDWQTFVQVVMGHSYGVQLQLTPKRVHLLTELHKKYTCIVLITKPSSGIIHTNAFISYYQLQLSYEPIYK